MEESISFSLHVEEHTLETKASVNNKKEATTGQEKEKIPDNSELPKKLSDNADSENGIDNTLNHECHFTALGLTEVEKYIHKEGNIKMMDSKCEEHMEACKACSISKQVTPADKIVLEKMKENLVAIPQPNNTFQLETKYAFLKEPQIKQKKQLPHRCKTS